MKYGDLMQPFSILIPTWKNLAFLDLAYMSLVKNSKVEHEIIIYFNEFDEKCEHWIKGKNVKYVFSENNIGICKAVNLAALKATKNYLCYFNDDMYALPGWDSALEPFLNISDKLWLSGTAIERNKAAKCYIGFQDYGDSPETFKEQDLLNDFMFLKRPYNIVSTWPPTIIPKSNWEAIGGLDENYFPGFGSDPDLAMRMYKYGCRNFIGVGTSLVYHFSKGTTSRFAGRIDSDSRTYFKKKWGVSRSHFLKRMICRDKVITPDLIKKNNKN